MFDDPAEIENVTILARYKKKMLQSQSYTITADENC